MEKTTLDKMVDRFLCWKLPKDFGPDSGISFAPTHFQQGEETEMDWVSVDEALPEDGQAVLVRYRRDNWLRTHTLADGATRLNWRWQAAVFVRGRTEGECEAMNLYRAQDQWGNNRVPYRWEQFGPGDLFGQDVSHWAAITDPLQPNA